jgi:hypothetical protein
MAPFELKGAGDRVTLPKRVPKRSENLQMRSKCPSDLGVSRAFVKKDMLVSSQSKHH